MGGTQKARGRLTALLTLTALAVLGAAPAAQGADSTSLVAGTVGTELSLGVATPAALSFSHAAASTSSSLVTVTSTQASWTLSISDNNASANAGHMLKTVGGGAAATGSALSNALEWAPDGSTFSALSGTPATVGTGALVGTKTVTLRQALGAAENVTAGDIYALTAKYTVN